MNQDEKLNALKQMLTMIGSLATMAGILTSGQVSELTSAVCIAAPALLTISSVLWSVYSHWNMAKVPENSMVIPPGSVTPVVATAVAK